MATDDAKSQREPMGLHVHFDSRENVMIPPSTPSKSTCSPSQTTPTLSEEADLPGVKRWRSHDSLPCRSPRTPIEAIVERSQKSFDALVEGAATSEMAHIDAAEERWMSCDSDEGHIKTSLTGAQAHVLRMSASAEYANAVSMIAPLFVCIVYIYTNPTASWNVYLCCAAVIVHMPFSMLYHIQCAVQGKAIHPVDNVYRVGDQTFIMVAGAMYTFALSGTIWYGVATSALAVIYIYWLWVDYYNVCNNLKVDPSKGGAPGRRHSILMMVFLYVGPTFIDGDHTNAICAVLSFFAAASLFVTYPLGEYSHALFHLVLAPFQWFILRCADDVKSFSFELPVVDGQYGLLGLLVVSTYARHGPAKYK